MIIKNKADKKQLQLIHVAKAQLGIDDLTYREMLSQHFNVASSKELSYNQATFFIDFFKQKGFRLKKKKSAPIQGHNIVSLASKSQRTLIDILKSNILWRVDNGYEAWILKRLGIKKVITNKDAIKVIEGLKGMLKISTPIIQMKALPFPHTLEPKVFIDPKSGETRSYVWLFDTAAKRLVCVNVEGKEEKCLTLADT